jgi:hypothetical protein
MVWFGFLQEKKMTPQAGKTLGIPVTVYCQQNVSEHKKNVLISKGARELKWCCMVSTLYRPKRRGGPMPRYV